MSVLWESGLEQEVTLYSQLGGGGDSQRSPWLTRVPTLGSSMPIPAASRPVNPAQPPAPRPEGTGQRCGSSVYLQSLQPFAIESTSPGRSVGTGDEVTRCRSHLPLAWLGQRGPRYSHPSPRTRGESQVPLPCSFFCLLEPKLRVQTQGHCTGGRHSHPKSRP